MKPCNKIRGFDMKQWVIDPVFGFNKAQWLDFAHYLIRHDLADASVVNCVELAFS